ncbi:hypothetical protein [Mesorhizobium sp.]|uniref:hypothetical protein n=1 Tax=Mesorhizobium sp. TaxID=1871066 RepID=UPI000FE8EA7F|nr:hypothetical protein [Mesorhizobium sp.]RWO59029.1 MAG: hypothetical protein EOS14_16345 [Mesorhizobium sp.]
MGDHVFIAGKVSFRTNVQREPFGELRTVGLWGCYCKDRSEHDRKDCLRFHARLPHLQPDQEPPAFGSFSLAQSDIAIRTRVDEILEAYSGSESHRDMAKLTVF